MFMLLTIFSALIPVANAQGIDDYGFECNSDIFLGCGFVGQGVSGFVQLFTTVLGRIFTDTTTTPLLVILCFFMIVYGAVRIILARGQQDGIEAGKKAIMWAVIGAILIMVGAVIVGFVRDFLFQIAG